jgi:hypothetical protein
MISDKLIKEMYQAVKESDDSRLQKEIIRQANKVDLKKGSIEDLRAAAQKASEDAGASQEEAWKKMKTWIASTIKFYEEVKSEDAPDIVRNLKNWQKSTSSK